VATDASELKVERRISPYQRLRKLFESYRGKEQLIVLKGVPDPDAISSALALKMLASLHEIETTILVFRQPSHHENRALVKRLGIQLTPYEEGFKFKNFACYSIVDSQKFTTKVDEQLKAADVDFLAFIDHHREEVNGAPARFCDVRMQAGSTAAIVSEYLAEAFPSGLDSSQEEHVRLATALMHGIRSDTHKFRLASRLEYEAAAFLSTAVDSQTLASVEQLMLSSAVLGILENALVRRRVHDNFIFSDVGSVRAAERDGIPQAADLLLSREGTDTVLVVGLVDDEFIDGSFRTSSQRISPDEFLKGLLGTSPESGDYYGGGNLRDRGGFQVPLGFLGLHDDKEQVYTMALDIIERSFMKHIGLQSTEEKQGQKPVKSEEE